MVMLMKSPALLSVLIFALGGSPALAGDSKPSAECRWECDAKATANPSKRPAPLEKPEASRWPQRSNPWSRGPAQGQSPSNRSSSSNNSVDEVRELVSKGKILPLTSILAKVAKVAPGVVIGVDLAVDGGRRVYRIDVLNKAGDRKRVEVDPITGAILRVTSR
jgi:hypothetical protein